MNTYHHSFNHDQMRGLSQSKSQMLQSLKGHLEGNTGNICAYVSGAPVQYHKLNVKHWPSQDYQVPHPKGFTHTMVHTQRVEEVDRSNHSLTGYDYTQHQNLNSYYIGSYPHNQYPYGRY